ncbi:MAG TPA: aromatic amino acid lyase [Solirubrobacteraceae bacterium]|nr:aromatic amino acid lyase [Solirubrobacteraceae bacterium]
MAIDAAPLPVRTRSDITLELVHAVAWRRAALEIAPEALAVMDRCQESFEALVSELVGSDPQALIYGVTSAPGDAAGAALTDEAKAGRPGQLWTAMSFGDPLPDRVVRAILVARLANFLDGHAAVRSVVAQAVAAMLDSPPLPVVPGQSNGGSGEILALGSLFFELSRQMRLTPKERMALINGSPCAAALVADVALAVRRRIELVDAVFALVAETCGAPDEHFASELGELWGDEHEAAALGALRALLEGSDRVRQRHQASVSVRILPRVLGAARRAMAAAEHAATISLRSVTDNPVYLPPNGERSLGAVYSNGGYHNAQAAPAIDAVAFAQADLCQLAQRLTDHLFQSPVTARLVGYDEWSVKPLHMAQNGWAEEARATAGPTLLSLGGFGQNDVPVLNFLAWRKATAIGQCLDASLAVLAAIASQALYVGAQEPPPNLRELTDRIRASFPPVDRPRALGDDCRRLTDAFTRRVFD